MGESTRCSRISCWSIHVDTTHTKRIAQGEREFQKTSQTQYVYMQGSIWDSKFGGEAIIDNVAVGGGDVVPPA